MKTKIVSDYKYNEEKYNPNAKKIERNCLIITSILNISLAIVEIIFYFLTDSSSILFDGIFSCIMSLTSLSALLLTIIIKKNSFNFPFGKSIYDNIFALFKNLLLFVVSIYFIVDASMIINGLVKNTYTPEEFANMNIYIAYISVACGVSLITFIIYLIYNKILTFRSIVLKTELKATIMDFLISFVIGLALLVSNFKSNDTFIREMVDKCLTLVLVVLMLPTIIKSFIEELMNISGYRMYKDEEHELKIHLEEPTIVDIYIQRHNQQKIFMITLKVDEATDVIKIKQKITNHIFDHYSKDTLIYYLV